MKANGNRPTETAWTRFIKNKHNNPENYVPTMASRNPTKTKPGSAARIAVYAARFARGEPIFHPEDDVDSSSMDAGTLASVILPKYHRRRS